MKDNRLRTALISVTDKKNLVPLAKMLEAGGTKLLSSSGTKKHLAENGIEAVEIAEYTGSPELLDGRVKTLHPKIHAGILADRENPAHMSQLEQAGVLPIDLVIVNLYPFEEKYKNKDLSESELCEFIDIGGITLIRAAAKNYRHVAVVTDPSQYDEVMSDLKSAKTISLETRTRLAREAFGVTCSYDAAIETFFKRMIPETVELPERVTITLEKTSSLRYGENPHQTGAIYRTPEDSALVSFDQHQGKELSYNNYLDLVGAFSLARDIGKGSVSILKHTNPCGIGWCGDELTSFRRALATDRVSAFGGIVAVNGTVGQELANEMNQLFLEVVLARSYDDTALEVFGKKKNLRVLTIPESYWDVANRGYSAVLFEQICLVQNVDSGFPELEDPDVVTKRAPTETERRACSMGWKVAKHVKSNAIVIADEDGTVGIGAGQMSRVDSSQIATRKAFDAGFSLLGKIAASDAFFPFPDGVTTLANAGITAVIQPGGSIRDQEVIEAANAANVAMMFTGRRHFRHI
ncbi:MAG: bifunctional phosphoribosylaminoimidazolecarboxamide formyltransferase/IMP cyclohydrolase [Candidatus Latescibacterota bacterium]|nr:MAG: bifunctional phosphoribosylaminoimidazolecarboxamide formyltransferase/IMP cyclohydrolase [Candidatus Latescibacterota bacterium]